MPLPNDEKLLALAEDLIRQITTIFGDHPGFRPVHAKGAMFAGTFKPSSEAASLTKAPHMTRPSTPVTMRFSDATAHLHSTPATTILVGGVLGGLFTSVDPWASCRQSSHVLNDWAGRIGR